MSQEVERYSSCPCPRRRVRAQGRHLRLLVVLPEPFAELSDERDRQVGRGRGDEGFGEDFRQLGGGVRLWRL